MMARGFPGFLFSLCLAALSYGCATFPTASANLGFVPDHPEAVKDTAYEIECGKHNDDRNLKLECIRFYAVDKWAHDRETAYRKRAAINAGMYYVAAGIGIVAGTIVTALVATGNSSSDAVKLTPPVASGLAGLAALLQHEEKAEAYVLTVTAINEAIRETERSLGTRIEGLTANAYWTARQALEDSIHQEMLNLQKRLAAILKKVASSIGTIIGLIPEFFTTHSPESTVTITVNRIDLEASKNDIRVTIDHKSASVNLSTVTKNSIQFTLPKQTECKPLLIILYVKGELILPPKTLNCRT